MARQQELNWHEEVPELLLTGERFDVWTEESGQTVEYSCLVRVDENGFFIHWKAEDGDSSVLECSSVWDVRRGTAPRDTKIAWDLELKGEGSLEYRTMALITGQDLVNNSAIYMAANEEKIAQVWTEALRKVISNFKINHLPFSMRLRKHWQGLTLSANSRGRVPVKLISRTFASGRGEKAVLQAMKDAGLDITGGDVPLEEFTFEHFYKVYCTIVGRPGVENLFKSLSVNRPYIQASRLVTFLNEIQRDPRLNELLYPFYDEPRARQLIAVYEQDTTFKQQGLMSADGLAQYLMSRDNMPVFSDRVGIYQDMDQPLCHYYVNSSHNTYLAGRQFGGKSCSEMYRQVLLTGCRCVELDFWDGNNGEPILTHGKAMCSDVNAKECIQAIKDTAFVASEYPVILSFENHCSKDQQAKIAKYCEEIFGDLLQKEPIPTHPLLQGTPLPSPNQLKRKIIIKNKRLKPDLERRQLDMLSQGALGEELDDIVNEGDNDDDASAEAAKVVEEMERRNEATTLPGDSDLLEVTPDQPTEKRSIRNIFKRDPGISEEAEAELLANYKYQGATTNVHPNLSRIVNYTHPVKFLSFALSEARNLHYHMSSFNENAGLQLLRTQATEFVNYNKRQISRIYPKGGRVDSSNFMPQVFWNAGCQMVALNFQTNDLAMQLNQGKFEFNGRTGYLLKPDFMRRPDRAFDPFSESSVDGVIAASCEIQVISGLFLSEKRISSYVEVDMYGLPADTIRKEFRTKTVPQNGVNPHYDSIPFVFRKIVLPDLAVLRFAVFDDAQKIVGQRILPLDGIMAGYRHISLYSEANQALPLATLFVKIVMNTYVQEGLEDFVDMLSDPRAFKERERLKAAAAVTSSDADVRLEGSNNDQSTAKLPSHLNISRRDKPAQALNLPPITPAELRENKLYQKLVKKQAKELEALKRSQSKALLIMQREHSESAEKLLRSESKKRSADRPSASEAQQKMAEVVSEHTTEWSALRQRHQDTDYEMQKSHVEARHSLLCKLLELACAEQVKELKLRQEAEAKERRSAQAKWSVESMRQLMTENSTLSKQERDRRCRELKEQNLKRFVEERRHEELVISRQMSQLEKQQAKQRDELAALLAHTVRELDVAYKESLTSLTPQVDC